MKQSRINSKLALHVPLAGVGSGQPKIARGAEQNRVLLICQVDSGPQDIVTYFHELARKFGAQVKVLSGKTQATVESSARSFLENWRREKDLRDLYIFGHGLGAEVVATLALTYPRPFGGAMISSGRFELSTGWRQRVTASAFFTPQMILQGHFDESAPIEQRRDVYHQLHSVGLPITYRELNKGGEFDADLELPLFEAWLKVRVKARVQQQRRPLDHSPDLN